MEVDMRTKLGVPLVLVVGALLAGLIWMPSATGQTVLHIVSPSDGLKARFVDHDGDGLRQADRIAAHGPVTDTGGSRMGTGYADCVVSRHIRNDVTGLWNCTYVIDLADGDLVLRGLDPRGPGVYELAVLGGTGTYANASGEATFTDTDEATDMVITLNN
jgi:hypothetical protein